MCVLHGGNGLCGFIHLETVDGNWAGKIVFLIFRISKPRLSSHSTQLYTPILQLFSQCLRDIYTEFSMISQRFEGYEWESGISLFKLKVTWNYGITVLLNKIILFKFYLIILNSGSTISVTILQVSNPVWYVGNPDKATVDLTSGDPTHLFKNGWLFSHWVPLNWYLGFLFDN